MLANDTQAKFYSAKLNYTVKDNIITHRQVEY